MKRLEEVAASLGVATTELTVWIEARWVLPAGEAGAWEFTEADEARARMIAELAHDLAIDPEAMPVVLHLLDQLHAARRSLRTLCDALAALPAPLREAVERQLGGERQK